MPLTKIISGGQTGVDRAALDAAIAAGIPHGGWCPRGRLAEDGRIPDRYALRELDSPDYAARTEQNVLDSDGTLILHTGDLSGGTLLTHRLARRHHRPCLTIDLTRPASSAPLHSWLAAHAIEILNIAGPRESSEPGIYGLAVEYLASALRQRQREHYRSA